jgi:hypothetical protein
MGNGILYGGEEQMKKYRTLEFIPPWNWVHPFREGLFGHVIYDDGIYIIKEYSFFTSAFYKDEKEFLGAIGFTPTKYQRLDITEEEFDE